MIGTPITHERFLRRHRGSYGKQGPRPRSDAALC
jgi:hypothetical protein